MPTRVLVGIFCCAYFASSLFMNAPNSAGLLVKGSDSGVPKRVLASVELEALTNAWFSGFTTSTGVSHRAGFQ